MNDTTEKKNKRSVHNQAAYFLITFAMMFMTAKVAQTVTANRHYTGFQDQNTGTIGLSDPAEDQNEEHCTLAGELAALKEENARLQKKTSLLAAAEGSFEYQKKYPDMIVEDPPAFVEDPEHAAYLTFDDGPSKETEQILDELKCRGAKATFFIVGANIAGHEDLLKRMVEEGHTVAVHSYTHQYREIYASVDAFLDDFYQTYTRIYEACGVYPTIFRFPGGSINSYNSGIYKQIIAEMLRRGFVYYDWNITPEEMVKKVSSQQLATSVLRGAASETRPVILMHDSNTRPESADAVGSILAQMQAKGYVLLPLTNSVRPVTFGYR